MIRKLLAILPLAISSAAFAANEGSEYMHQAPAGKWEVTPQVDYHDYTLKHTTGSNTDAAGVYYGAAGEYGINDMFSVGAKITANNEKWKQDNTTSNTSGLRNIDIYGLGKNDIGMGLIRYGLNLAVSTAKAKLDGNGFPTNNDSGATWLTPFVGWEMAMGPGIFGAKFSYTFQLTDRKYDDGSGAIDKETGVNSEKLAVFYEWQADTTWSLGVSLAWNSVNGSKTTTPAGASSNADTGHAGPFVDVYAPITIAQDILLIPNVGWGDDGNVISFGRGLKTVQMWDVGVAARFTF